MRFQAVLFALAVLAAAVLPGLAAPAAAAASLTYDFTPGQSALAVRTDPSLVRCFELRLDAVVPAVDEFAMAGLYLFDGFGNAQFAFVQTAYIGVNGPVVHVTTTTPGGSGIRTGLYPVAGGWEFNLRVPHCLSAPRTQSTVFAAVTSSGVQNARVVFTATDGTLPAPRAIAGSASALRVQSFEGVALDAGFGFAAGAAVATTQLTVTKGLLASFISFDTATLLTVDGEGMPQRAYAVRDCDTTGATALCSGQSVAMAAIRGGAGLYEFTAATASYRNSFYPANAVFLLAADLRFPTAA